MEIFKCQNYLCCIKPGMRLAEVEKNAIMVKSISDMKVTLGYSEAEIETAVLGKGYCKTKMLDKYQQFAMDGACCFARIIGS